jgi:diphthamide biosynthesis protein 2
MEHATQPLERNMTITAVSQQPLPPPPPVLQFDEGSRQEPDNTRRRRNGPCAPPRLVSVAEYYEVERWVSEIASLAISEFAMLRIAIQLPDALLGDAAALSWAFETALFVEDARPYFVFVLGDTTYAPCCPDLIASQHLEAHVLLHYGHACFSNVARTERPDAGPRVWYSFGKQPLDVTICVQEVVPQFQHECLEQDPPPPKQILLLYELPYAHAMGELSEALHASLGVPVHRAKIPTHTAVSTKDATTRTFSTLDVVPHPHRVLVGGLELPPQFSTDRDVPAPFLLLYIGSVDSRPFLNIVLRFLSDPQHCPAQIWTWSPTEQTLSNVLAASSACQRILPRRYFLVQKAQSCRTFGILVAQMTAPIQAWVASIRGYLASHRRTGYTLVVGKIHPTKLANFPEVECFILVACPEHSLLPEERELYPTPIITPYELLVALGHTEWGAVPYSTHPSEYWSLVNPTGVSAGTWTASGTGDEHGQDKDDDDDADAPYFSLVTGGYAQKTTAAAPPLPNATAALTSVTEGTLMARMAGSAVARFFQKREYQGLVPLDPATTSEGGDATAVPAAVMGRTGIASNYGNR